MPPVPLCKREQPVLSPVEGGIRWLHGFYASHAAPYPLRVAYLHKLSGSQTKQLKPFKQNLSWA